MKDSYGKIGSHLANQFQDKIAMLNSWRNVSCVFSLDAGFGSVVLVHTSCGMSAIQNLIGSSIFVGALSSFVMECFSLSKNQNKG